MFRALDQVLHLIQDLSQLEHVRNTQHIDKVGPYDAFTRSYIEGYGGKNYVNLLDNPVAYERANVLPQRPFGFKLRDFWDRDVLSRGSPDQNTDDSDLGLAEFTNKNYLGIRSLYKEFYPDLIVLPYDIHRYDHPSLTETNIGAVFQRLSNNTALPAV